MTSHGLRVVYVADSTADVRMVEALAARLRVTLVAPAALGERISTGTITREVRRVLLPGGKLLFNLRAAAWLVAHRREIDAVLVLDNLRAALAANLAGRLARRPVVIQVGRPTEAYFRCKRRGTQLRGVRFWLGLLAVKALVAVNERLAAAVGATSEYVAEQSRRQCRRVEFIPAYGVDVQAFAPRTSPDEARRALGLPEGETLVLFRSRLAPEKDPETFLRALATLRRQGRNVKGLYVGAEYSELVSMAGALGVPVIGRDHVHPLTELPLFYRAASVTVQTSHAQGGGMSPLESLACEVPCVVTRVGGLVEVATGGKTAVLVPPRDPEAVAAAVAWVLDHPDAAGEMAGRGRRLVVAPFTSETAFEAWARLTAEVCRRDGVAASTDQEVSAG